MDQYWDKSRVAGNPENIASLSTGLPSRYGFGWVLDNHPSLGKKIFHTGDNPGYKTIIIRYVDAGFTLIVLCNNADAKFDDIVQRIEKLLAGGDALIWTPAVKNGPVAHRRVAKSHSCPGAVSQRQVL